MKILLPVKRVIDPYVKVRVKPDKTGVETERVKMSINPFDEIAVEEAIRLQEKNIATELVALSIGPQSTQETLRHTLALGVTRAIHVLTDLSFCSLNIAKIICAIIQDEKPNLVLMGKQAIDGDNNQTPQMVAGLLNWPQATFASNVSIAGNTVKVTREIDGGLETLELPLPAVISTDLRLNEPRYTNLFNISRAKQKPYKTIQYEDLGLNLSPHLQVLEVNPPTTRQSGIKLGSVAELINKLKYEAEVL